MQSTLWTESEAVVAFHLVMPETHVTEPGKLVRITTMARAMLEEARSAPCDAAGCERLRRIHERVIAELSDAISAELYEELLTLAVRFEEVSPSPSEVRVAQAELVGWLEGVMAGVVVGVAQSNRPSNQAEAEAGRPQTNGYEAHGMYL